MPELPEVETIRLQLGQSIRGLLISKVQIFKAKSFIGKIGDIIDRKIVDVDRRAKIILLKLDNGNILAVHLKMTGQLIYKLKAQKAKVKIATQNSKVVEEKQNRYDVTQLPNKYTRVVVEFSNGSKLYFNDLRMFGWMKVINNAKFIMNNEETRTEDKELYKLIGKFGPEALEKDFTDEYFRHVLSKTSRSIKLVIMDQEKLAGVGNIYANEALFMARIDPRKKANQMTAQEVKLLREAIISVLKKAIKFGGTTDRDDAFRQITGEKGCFQKHLQVYGRAKQKCLKCKGEVKRISLGGRGTFFCEKCQQ